MHQTTLTFPQIQLQRRDGHKLRGYFAQQFGQESDLFHNHDEAGKAIYRYPRIQYKVVRGVPMVMGLDKGAELIVERFLRIKYLDIDGLRFFTDQKNMKSQEYLTGVKSALYQYEFVNPWMPLNQANHKLYIEMSKEEQVQKLQRILCSNMISFFKSVGHQEAERIMVNLQLEAPQLAGFKDQKLWTFKGGFVSNVQLPDYIGLGKSVARGFGTIRVV